MIIERGNANRYITIRLSKEEAIKMWRIMRYLWIMAVRNRDKALALAFEPELEFIKEFAGIAKDKNISLERD